MHKVPTEKKVTRSSRELIAFILCNMGVCVCSIRYIPSTAHILSSLCCVRTRWCHFLCVSMPLPILVSVWLTHPKYHTSQTHRKYSVRTWTQNCVAPKRAVRSSSGSSQLACVTVSQVLLRVSPSPCCWCWCCERSHIHYVRSRTMCVVFRRHQRACACLSQLHTLDAVAFVAGSAVAQHICESVCVSQGYYVTCIPNENMCGKDAFNIRCVRLAATGTTCALTRVNNKRRRTRNAILAPSTNAIHHTNTQAQRHTHG